VRPVEQLGVLTELVNNPFTYNYFSGLA